jgi:hypothetical protein
MATVMVTHFARVDFRDDDRVFGIKSEDRFVAHVHHWKDRHGEINVARDYGHPGPGGR